MENFYPIDSIFTPRTGDNTLNSAAPAFNISENAPAISRTWEGYILIATPGIHTLKIGADDNGSVKISKFPKNIEILEGTGPQGGGKFRYSTGTQVTISENGYYKIEITYTNIDYKPTTGNAAKLEVLVDEQPITLGDVLPSITCKPNEWPKEDIILAHPIKWYEVTQDNDGNKKVIDKGTIDKVTFEEFKIAACIIFGEQSKFNHAEYMAIASVFLNRWGHGMHGSLDNRTIIKTVSADIRNKNTWDSIGRPQYNKAMKGEVTDKDEQIALCRAKQILKQVLESGPIYPYDRQVSHPGGLDASNYINIGGHDFYKNKQLRNCDKPSWYNE